MTTTSRTRASDADRQRIAARVQDAGAEGRLTLDEVEQRLSAVYAARYEDELSGFVADLPAPPAPARPRFPVPLRVHAGVVGVFSVLLVVAWAFSGAPFFWPVAPLFWLYLSLAGHAFARNRFRLVP
ncbi:DUF1707 domain-containing protein [Amycolatopsis acidicola]|uniref:DUF1707 domain-containing protein n=1 Tax=Amycolatopsis acidicola TaxID=2596893 RepID=A0A5N0USI1_9PSEU|nr:DUF1707 domain-containing protein [Amycolatopsis acidicola]KAA9152555.1 DUF1707 domain-containing protein [Amycolatopsis acidicola]